MIVTSAASKGTWVKRDESYQTWLLMGTGKKGEHIFSFDKQRQYNVYRDYPWELTKEQRRIFDAENPFWRKQLKYRSDRWETIDTSFDFTSDIPKYWEGYWEQNDGMGGSDYDPDTLSPTLQEYHRILWSRRLPNGDLMVLEKGDGPNYLTWNNMRFGSDSIIASFRYKKYRFMIEQVMSCLGDCKAFYEQYTRHSYTIGGMIIFPKHKGSMNQNRGTNRLISDRWDLTLECIRRYYAGEESPLTNTIESDRDFFDLFVDFKGYVDYFFLQDCVSDDYSKVEIWHGDSSFTKDGLPGTVEEYLMFIDKELKFLDKRNARIREFRDKMTA